MTLNKAKWANTSAVPSINQPTKGQTKALIDVYCQYSVLVRVKKLFMVIRFLFLHKHNKESTYGAVGTHEMHCLLTPLSPRPSWYLVSRKIQKFVILCYRCCCFFASSPIYLWFCCPNRFRSLILSIQFQSSSILSPSYLPNGNPPYGSRSWDSSYVPR